MKSLERLVLKHIRALVEPSLDPLQFAYQPHIGVEDAIIYLLHRAYSHLEEAGSVVRVTLFASHFNSFEMLPNFGSISMSGCPPRLKV